MPRVGFEPTIPAIDRAKTFHALDSAIIVICSQHNTYLQFECFQNSVTDS
jgi:hypothetical protein